ncbi:hypothetical protein GXW82_44435 [Streptacidiphilus sp. 4-A2]|nr:hypothetical protein [Streptacidiphilus sp. 4-A2]
MFTTDTDTPGANPMDNDFGPTTTEPVRPAGPGRTRQAVDALRDGPIGLWLRLRGSELTDAVEEPGRARIWIKASTAVVLAAPALALTAALLGSYAHSATTIARDLAATPIGRHAGDLVAVTTHPVRLYLDQHAAVLPIHAGTLYALWQLLAAVLWLASARHGTRARAGARTGWLLLGAVTGAMVWAATPAAGQALATGEYTLLWALISIPALRGLNLRPAIHIDARPRTTP